MGRVLAVIIWIITLLSVLLFFNKKWWLPEAISDHAPALDRQFMITIIVVGISFAAALIALGWAVWMFRDTGKDGDVAVYSGNVNGGSSRTNETGDASVSVNRPGERVFLILSAYEPVRWHVMVAADTTIESVLLLGYYHQTVDGLPASVPVVELTGQTGSSSYFYFGPDMNSGSFLVGVQRLCGITGQDITSFTGAYTAPHPAPFVVDSVQDDPRLQCDYPQPVDPSQVPNLNFSLSFNDG